MFNYWTPEIWKIFDYKSDSEVHQESKSNSEIHQEPKRDSDLHQWFQGLSKQLEDMYCLQNEKNIYLRKKNLACMILGMNSEKTNKKFDADWFTKVAPVYF